MAQYDAATLRDALSRRADPKVKEHWTAYLKGNADFLGIPMAGVRETVNGFWDSGLAELDPTAQRPGA